MAWLVGGWVRDELLGRPSRSDVDIVLLGDALQAAEILARAGVASQPPVLYSRFGTAMVRVGDLTLELVTARRESYSKDSRKPRVEPASLLEDAQRRDFTVNALLLGLWDGKIVDPLGLGLRDLESRTLRTPREPSQTFSDDPLRMLRAVRFKWQLGGWSFAPGLAESIAENAHRLEIVSAERTRDELIKMLALVDADKALCDLLELGLLARFAPELAAMRGVEQGDYHHLDAFDHTCFVVRNVGPSDLTLSLAALLHDLGKPRTRVIDAEGKTRFFGHETVGATLAREWLEAMRFSGEMIANVALLVKNHMRFTGLTNLSPSAARRLVRDLGDQLDRLLALVEADANALKPGVRGLDLGPIRAQIAETLRETPRETLVSPLDGNEISTLTGLGSGPSIGRIKKQLTEMVLSGELRAGDQEAARAWVLSTFATRDGATTSSIDEGQVPS